MSRKKSSLSVDFLDTTFPNPTVLASGILGISPASLHYTEVHGVGGVTTKSIGHIEREGHTSPSVFPFSETGMINAVGLSNQGIDQSMPLLKEMIEKVHVPVIISFFADTDDNYAHVAKQLVTLKPPLVEMNASCPNTEDDFGMAFALSENALQTLTRKVRAVLPTETKLIVKLSPNVPNIGRMGQVAEAEGADAICAINTVPGMVIDVPSRKPVLTNVSGGISGDVIRPIAVKAVYDLYKAVKIPIIGTGGVSTGEHALEMMMAGATLVGVGSAVYSQGVDVFSAITTEMQTIMKRHGIVTLSEIIGAAHA